jgi:hypothetical protein
MFELIALTLFVAVPWSLGYLTGTYWVSTLPLVSLVLAVALYAADPPDHTDEVDVLPGLFAAASAIAVVTCLGGAAIRRRSRRS